MAHALFANQRESNLASTVALVEAVLGELRYDAAASRYAPDAGTLHAWQIRKGSAVTTVSLVSRSEFTHLRVSSTVMTIDGTVDRASLHTHVLALNNGLCGAAFATTGDHIVLVAERSTLDLDHSEVRELIKRVTTYADDHDDALVAKFGGLLGAG